MNAAEPPPGILAACARVARLSETFSILCREAALDAMANVTRRETVQAALDLGESRALHQAAVACLALAQELAGED